MTDDHIDHVARRMRPCDQAEIWASSRSLPIDALREGEARSVWSRSGLVDGKAVCIFGVGSGSILSGVGVPWMLATRGLERVARPFLRLSVPAVDMMNDIFPTLVNYVDDRNTTTHRWLGWLGFTLDPPAPHGVAGLPFRRFSRIR